MDSSTASSQLTLLGGGPHTLPDAPDRAIIEMFPNRHPHQRYWVTFHCEDFTSLCPITGQPDFARLEIRYRPGDRCIETKSLKFYLAAYRSTKRFNEEIVNQILEDLVAVCEPGAMVVHGLFSARGGIQVEVEAIWPASTGEDAA